MAVRCKNCGKTIEAVVHPFANWFHVEGRRKLRWYCDLVSGDASVHYAYPEEGVLMSKVPAPCCGCACTACHSGNCCKSPEPISDDTPLGPIKPRK